MGLSCVALPPPNTSASVTCLQNAAAVGLWTNDGCAGSPSFTGSSRTGSCVSVSAEISYAVVCGDGPMPSPHPTGPAIWGQFGMDSRHTGSSPYAGATEGRVKWRFFVGSEYAYSGSYPVIAADGTVVGGKFAFDGESGIPVCFSSPLAM